MFKPKNMTYEELEDAFEKISIKLANRELCAKRISESIINNRAPDYVYHQNMNLRTHVASMYY